MKTQIETSARIYRYTNDESVYLKVYSGNDGIVVHGIGDTDSKIRMSKIQARELIKVLRIIVNS